jgi:hypothetical protein
MSIRNSILFTFCGLLVACSSITVKNLKVKNPTKKDSVFVVVVHSQFERYFAEDLTTEIGFAFRSANVKVNTLLYPNKFKLFNSSAILPQTFEKEIGELSKAYPLTILFIPTEIVVPNTKISYEIMCIDNDSKKNVLSFSLITKDPFGVEYQSKGMARKLVTMLKESSVI